MYQRFAAVYDAIYSFKNYAEESEKLAAIAQRKNPNARTLLDVGCGSGAHLQCLKDHFACVGVDLSGDLLAVAREKLPDVEFVQADMRAFDLGRQFAVVTCLFGAIAYMQNQEELNLAIANIAKHLAPGGVLIIEPFVSRSKFRAGTYGVMTGETLTMKVARTNTSRREGNIGIIDFDFLVVDSEKTDHFKEIHRMGLYDDEDYIAAFASAGLDAEIDEQGLMGRGLYVATRH